MINFLKVPKLVGEKPSNFPCLRVLSIDGRNWTAAEVISESIYSCELWWANEWLTLWAMMGQSVNGSHSELWWANEQLTLWAMTGQSMNGSYSDLWWANEWLTLYICRLLHSSPTRIIVMHCSCAAHPVRDSWNLAASSLIAALTRLSSDLAWPCRSLKCCCLH